MLALIVSIFFQIIFSIYYSHQSLEFNLHSERQQQTITNLTQEHQDLQQHWAILNRLRNFQKHASISGYLPINQSLDLNDSQPN